MADNRPRSPIPESLPTDVVGPYEITELIAMDQAFVASSHCNCDRIVASLAGFLRRPGSHPSLLGRTSVRRECREDFMRCDVCVMAAAIMAFGAIGSTATAQQGSSIQQATTADPASNPDQELGRRFLIKAENLPPPKTGEVAASRSLLIPYAGQVPRVM